MIQGEPLGKWGFVQDRMTPEIKRRELIFRLRVALGCDTFDEAESYIPDGIYFSPDDFGMTLDQYAERYIEPLVWRIVVAKTPPEVLNYWTA